MRQTQQLIIVRRNQFATFEMLAQAFAGEPNVRLVWDRRVRERRANATQPGDRDRRRTDRRKDPSLTWGSNDYLLLPVGERAETHSPSASIADRIEAQIRRDIEAAVQTDLAVLISGGDPVARKSMAYQIHRRTHGFARPLVVFDQDALADMFTSAVSFERWTAAQGGAGTLLFEEVGELTPEQQAAMAAFFEHRDQQRKRCRDACVEPRIISGTNHWLLDRVAANEFRADLFYRLNRIHLVLPTATLATYQ